VHNDIQKALVLMFVGV